MTQLFQDVLSISLNVCTQRVHGIKLCVCTMLLREVSGRWKIDDNSITYMSSLAFRREGPIMLPQLHEGSIAACHMSHDAKLLVTGGYDLRVVLWDIESMSHKLVLRVSLMHQISK